MLGLLLGGAARATDVQGVITDWNCTETMVRNGREKTLRQNRDCSMMKNYKRPAYGLITDERKFYRLDDPGNKHILQLLQDTRDKDNLKVIVTGDVEGDTLHVKTISML